ncbi:MAG: hypothetical protein ACE5QF_03725 [Thermoplasmata archaeon]
MPTLLVHSLFSAAVQSLLNVALVGQGINEFTFWATISSILVNLDHRSDGKRSSVVHSVFTTMLVFAIGVLVVMIANNIWLAYLVLSVSIGFGGHITLDVLDGAILVLPIGDHQSTALRNSSRNARHSFLSLPLVIAVFSASVLLVLVVL